MKARAYRVSVSCLNCGLWHKLIRIGRGKTVADTPCPDCGCKALYRSGI